MNFYEVHPNNFKCHHKAINTSYDVLLKINIKMSIGQNLGLRVQPR